ncbi:MAG TPA: patatin-like phospholipase family protein [Azonexus sp.]|jgi:NTE family protein|nr:patatin-like phospholipase family protein [Azonexus sp.]
MIKFKTSKSLIQRTLACGIVGIALCSTLTVAAERPRVGLVLGGGGARGAAHIGILEVLRENRIPVDCVAGTSMGGLVTGAFAAGLSPDEMLAAMGEADWRAMFNDSPPVEDLNPRIKYQSRRFIPGTELGVTKEGAQPLPAVVQGQKVKLFINRLVRSQYGEPLIEKMPIPVSIIATDLVTGDKIVFREGSMTHAMRATMSVPGLMAPVKDGDRLLVDGGLVDNVPIDEVRKSCNPDVVIAVSVGSPLMKANEIGGIFSVAGQMVNILTEQNVTRSIATLKSGDIYIKPDLDGITAAEFGRYAETAKRGRAAAMAMLPRLQALSVGEKQYHDWLATMTPVRGKLPVVDEVQIAGLKRVNPAYPDRYLKHYDGAPVDVDRVDKDMGLIYGDGLYDDVDFALLSTRDRNILRVTPVEKEFGPDYLRFGFNLNAVTSGPSTFNLRVAYQKTLLNSLGGEWLAGVQVGNEPAVFTEFYQPLDAERRFFLEPKLSFQRAPLYIYQNNKRIAEYAVDQASLDLMAGINVGLWGPVAIGWAERYRSAELQTGSPGLPTGGKSFGGFLAKLDFDQFDRLYVPSKGWSAHGSYFYAAGDGYDKAELDLRAAERFGDYILQGRVRGAGSFTGTLPVYDAVALGGFLNLSGFARAQIVGESLAYGSVRAEKIVGQLPLGLRGDMRVGVALEAGKVNGRYTETNLNGWQNSVTAYVGGETPIGVVYLGYGYSPNGVNNFYVFIGTP